MAKYIKLFSDDNKLLMKVREAKIDICDSHTIIYKQFETVRLPLTVSKIQIGYSAAKVVVFYKEPYFIEILPEC
jgi:hypothetical protein